MFHSTSDFKDAAGQELVFISNVQIFYLMTNEDGETTDEIKTNEIIDVVARKNFHLSRLNQLVSQEVGSRKLY